MDLSEAEHAPSEYRSFRELFVRRLRPGTRQLNGDARVALCPVDGCLSSSGVADAGTLIQAKGIHFSVVDLVGDEEVGEQLQGGAYAVLYLRPKDYHRVHVPVSATLKRMRHIPGSLLPVQPSVVRNVDGLFVRNERVVFELVSEAWGFFVVVCVGATAVGAIESPMQPDACDVTLEKGDEIAAFNLGSTVIVLWGSSRVQMEVNEIGREVRLGDALARLNYSDNETAEPGVGTE